MGIVKNADLREHVRQYINATIAGKLRFEGFVSNKKDGIFWYRVKNGNVVQAIYFFTQYSYLPVTLEIGFGCHPLFISPEFSCGPILRDLPGNEVLYPQYILMGNANTCYAENILVSVPEDDSLVLNILDKILHVLDSATTPSICFDIHKKWREKAIANNVYIDVTPQFVDEVIFWEDRDLYPYCEKYILYRERLLENALLKNPKSKRYNNELAYLQLLKRPIVDGVREEHLMLLHQRELDTIRMLEKHTGIKI